MTCSEEDLCQPIEIISDGIDYADHRWGNIFAMNCNTLTSDNFEQEHPTVGNPCFGNSLPCCESSQGSEEAQSQQMDSTHQSNLASISDGSHSADLSAMTCNASTSNNSATANPQYETVLATSSNERCKEEEIAPTVEIPRIRVSVSYSGNESSQGFQIHQIEEIWFNWRQTDVR